MPPRFASDASSALPLHVIAEDGLDAWSAGQPAPVQNWIAAQGFTGGLGQALTIPAADGSVMMAVAGFGTAAARARGRFHLAAAAAKLPKGIYQIVSGLPDDQKSVEALGWLLSRHSFDRYKSQSPIAAELLAPEAVNVAEVEALAAGECLTRDLINTPASDMGPPDLEQAARDLGRGAWRANQRDHRRGFAGTEPANDPHRWPRGGSRPTFD